MIIRAIREADLPALIEMCAEHAAYERASYETRGKIEKLRLALFGNVALLRGWVAADRDELVGYATATIEFSTWNAQTFLDMDCLFVRSADRNRRIGRKLMSAVMDEAQRCCIDEIQWQTPHWNTNADRFYRKLGARANEKFRYTLSVPRVR